MAKKQALNPADYMEPLYMNGLHGRMLRLKPKPRKNKEILVVYGQHASLERLFSIAEDLNRYGGVTIPDLPGFGGMQSYYKLREKPTIDNLADYLASFVKLRYKNRRVTIIGISYGFAVVTRMLQRYPEIAKKVDLLISVVGFVHYEDLLFKKFNRWTLRLGAGVMSRQIASRIARLSLRPAFIKAVYNRTWLKDPDNQASSSQRAEQIAFEIHLWRTNDLRTYMYTTASMLKMDLCSQKVDLPVHYLVFTNDKYLNLDYAEQHLGVIYDEVVVHKAKVTNHVPSLTAIRGISSLLPASLKSLLARS